MILGTNVTGIGPAALAVLSNPHAIGVNQVLCCPMRGPFRTQLSPPVLPFVASALLQDPLGIQGRRVALQQPKNNSLTSLSYDNLAIAGG